MQKALIINDDNSGLSLKDLNGFLENDWTVIKTCPMTSACAGSCGNYEPTCLVILEKIEEEKKDDIPEVGLCQKCTYAITKRTDKGCLELVGCRIEANFEMGNNCPLTKRSGGKS